MTRPKVGLRGVQRAEICASYLAQAAHGVRDYTACSAIKKKGGKIL